MKFYLVLLLLAIHANGQVVPSTSRFTLSAGLDIPRGINLTVQMNVSGPPKWEFGGQTYAVLGSTLCPAGIRSRRSGTNPLNWTCDLANTTGNGDQIIAAYPQCTDVLSIPFSGPSSTSPHVCGADKDMIGDAGACPRDWTVKYNLTSGKFYCAKENDLIRDAAIKCAVNITGVPFVQSTTTANSPTSFSCSPVPIDLDFAKDLWPVCKDGNVIKYVNGNWTCADDRSLLLQMNKCAFNQTLVWNVTGTGVWSCGQETDTLRDLIPRCIARGGTTPIKNATTWECYPDEDVLIEFANGGSTLPVTSQVVWTAAMTVPAGQTSPASGYIGAANIPFYSPYQGNITAWAIRSLSGSYDVSLGLGGTKLTMFTNPTTAATYVNKVLSFPVSPNTDFGIRVTNKSNFPVTVMVDIYLSFTLPA